MGKFLVVLLLAFGSVASAGTPEDEAAIRAEFAALSDKINPSITIAKMREIEGEAARILSKAQRLKVAVPTVLQMQLENFSIARDTMASLFKARSVGVDTSQGTQRVLGTIENTRAQFLAFAQSPIPGGNSAPSAGNPPAPPSNSAPAAGVAGESKYLIEAERLAKSNNCVAPVATMNFKGQGSELFTVACSTGVPLSIRCDAGACRVMN